MTALEEIQQAIGTLERLKAGSTPGKWFVGDANGAMPREYGALWVVTNEETSTVRSDGEAPEDWLCEIHCGTREDAELIVTLHRTIDAQITLLRREHEFALKFGWPAQPFPERLDVLALARAINGSAS